MAYLPQDHRDYLKAEYELRLQRRPRYSLRAFARDLAMAPSTLVDFFKGRVGFSKERALFVANKICLSAEDREHFFDLLDSRFAVVKVKKQLAQLRVKKRLKNSRSHFSLDEFNLISQWHHMAILEVLALPTLNPKTAEVVAPFLGLPLAKVKSSLSRLQRLNLVEKLEDGSFSLQEEVTQVGDDVSHRAIRHFHSQILSLAQKSLETQEMSKRETQSVVFVMDPEYDSSFRAELKKRLLDLVGEYALLGSAKKVMAFNLNYFQLGPAEGKNELKED